MLKMQLKNSVQYCLATNTVSWTLTSMYLARKSRKM